ncbi:MAG: hypothetical protein JNN08_15405 [Bryobacterales bacterium]|nr:hypothetical protein [Bryobacterales bacterium]
MALSNITVSLPDDLVRDAKAYAAQHDLTIEDVLRKLLEEVVSRRSQTSHALQRLLALAGQGPVSDVNPASIRRQDLHERSS